MTLAILIIVVLLLLNSIGAAAGHRAHDERMEAQAAEIRREIVSIRHELGMRN
jgi:hypothetical protein